VWVGDTLGVREAVLDLVGGRERLREREPVLDLERVRLRERERLAEAASLRSATIR